MHDDPYLPPASSQAVIEWKPPRRRSGLRRAGTVLGAAGLLLGGVAIGVNVADAGTATVTAEEETAAVDNSTALEDTPALGDAPTEVPSDPGYGGTWPGEGGYPGGDSGYGAGVSTQAEATVADSDASTGVVLIDTVLGYDQGEAAGTGMVLTSDGLVLTNNHVIEDSTEITVTLATGETYSATVIGSDADDDVALLQLDGASGLTTVAIDDDGVTAGDAITAVGNASGGGVLMAADGSVTGLESSVTTSADFTTASETLDGMIEFSAAVVSGDSGGALLDSEGEVIGMTTAASTGSADVTAFAIPIDDALDIAAQIRSGDTSDGATIGYPAVLGVAVSGQAQIEYVYGGTPAETAGLAAGDTITSVDGVSVGSAAEISAVLAEFEPGDSVAITWTDTVGQAWDATVTLAQGPAA
ncbi:S1C family serine protease [Demequina silvatica]|uniref:S1C family serine protease n=1 Tax=Demequina silvatica TaxID=1638988 RepID=UPI00078056AE|nr:trypsin-like peptidase domain-containing protein [Demequina silvatica]